MAAPAKFQSHEQYFAAAAPEVQGHLRRIQASVRDALPEAEPCIRYGLPAFRLGRVFFYFAAFKKHIGVYPPVEGSADLQERPAPYRGPKGNHIFPLAGPVPHQLIGEVALALAAEDGVEQSRQRKQGAA